MKKPSDISLWLHPHRVYCYLLLCVLLSACAPLFDGYSINTLSDTSYPPTEKIDLIYNSPENNTYKVIATFVSRESQQPADIKNLPELIDKAKQLGADAIWIQNYHHYQHPGDWILLEGKMIRIYPKTKISYEGVLIKY